jgi:hypothetical protein
MHTVLAVLRSCSGRAVAMTMTPLLPRMVQILCEELNLAIGITLHL